MNTLTIKLKQHTPLIHFQHDQEGATLRASEVKPKLDRYIIETDFNNSFEKCKTYLVGYNPQKPDALHDKFNDGYRALNYKIRIEAENKVDAVRLQSESRTNNRGEQKFYSFWRRLNNGRTEEFPLILSNMGGKDNERDLLNFSLYEDIIITISSPEAEIYKALSYWIDVFFAKNNFGQRSSKGFGSFSVIEVNGEKKGFPEEELDSHYMRFKLTEHDPLLFQNKLFLTIDFYWKCLKSGINYTQYNSVTREYRYPNRYIKAFLWTYLNNQTPGQTWEKRRVKERFHLTTGRERQENPNSVSFARAVLGCPDKFEYRNMRKTVNIKHSENPNSDNFIARIPSPIIFKPIVFGNMVKIYMIPDYKIIEELNGRGNLTFIFECDRNEMTLDVNPGIIDVNDMISRYHDYIKDKEFGRKGFRNDLEYDDFINRNKMNDDTEWFIPLDFNWRRIINSPVILK